MNNTKSIELINKYRGQIMGISALWIIVFHTWYRLAVPETSPKLLYYAELAVTKLGYFGVDIFFPAVRHRAELCHRQSRPERVLAAQVQESSSCPCWSFR